MFFEKFLNIVGRAEARANLKLKSDIDLMLKVLYNVNNIFKKFSGEIWKLFKICS